MSLKNFVVTACSPQALAFALIALTSTAGAQAQVATGKVKAFAVELRQLERGNGFNGIGSKSRQVDLVALRDTFPGLKSLRGESRPIPAVARERAGLKLGAASGAL